MGGTLKYGESFELLCLEIDDSYTDEDGEFEKVDEEFWEVEEVEENEVAFEPPFNSLIFCLLLLFILYNVQSQFNSAN